MTTAIIPNLRIFVNGIALLVLLMTLATNTKADSGTPKDNEYAAKVWKVMQEERLIGKDRIRSYPFVGNRPHGSIQEIVSTVVTVEGHEGKLIVKHNYGAKDEITVHSVYEADQAENYEAITIMFQREEGYDEGNDNWFWAEYKPDGSIINYQGADLSGRSQLCIACHAALGGKDREILNGKKR